MVSHKVRSFEPYWRPWMLELSALAGSALSFLVMVVVLATNDGRPMKIWKGVTLNAVISVLSVAMKACLTFPVAEFIGQWKWIIFTRDSHPLMDFERIDMASRGPLGCLRVLSRTHGLWPLHLGALLMVLTIGLDPFSQQLLQLEQGTEYTEYTNGSYFTEPWSVYTTRAEQFYGGEIYLEHSLWKRQPSDPDAVRMATTDLGFPMRAAVLNGLAQSLSLLQKPALTQCPGGICSWDRFQTLGVCDKCHDLTSDLERFDDFGEVYDAAYYFHYKDKHPHNKTEATAFALPNGHFLMNLNVGSLTAGQRDDDTPEGEDVYPYTQSLSSVGTGDPQKTNRMQDINTLIWSMSAIHLDTIRMASLSFEKARYQWGDAPLGATECAIYYCVKSIDLQVEGNVLRENAAEAAEAVRDPDSFKLLPPDLTPYRPENIPPLNENATLEYDKFHSAIPRENLHLHFPHDSSKPIYEIKDTAVWSLSQYFQELLSINITGGANITAAISNVLPQGAFGYNGVIEKDTSKLAALEAIWNSGGPDLSGTFETLATSITNVIRQGEERRYLKYVYGRAGTPTKYYRTRWEWIVLHGLVLIGGALFWIMTVWDSARSPHVVPVWKNSSLATIRRGATMDEVLKGADTLQEIEKQARKRRVMIPLEKASTPSPQSNGYGDNNTHLMHRISMEEVAASPGGRVSDLGRRETM